MRSIFTLIVLAWCCVAGVAQTKIELIKDIFAGTSPGLSVPQFREYKGETYFVANGGASGTNLWKANGTQSGTIRCKDFIPSLPSGGVINQIVFDGKLYFLTLKHEFWRTDGTAAGTELVKSFAVPPGGTYSYGAPVIFKNKLWFVVRNPASDPSGELVYSDGTTSGTQFFRKADSTQAYIKNPVIRMVTDSMLYVTGDVGAWGVGTELIKTDGTVGGTKLLKDLVPGSEGIISNDFFMHNDGQKLYFNAPTAATTVSSFGKLWVTNGTTAGTTEVLSQSVVISKELATYAGNTYYNGYDTVTKTDGLWRTSSTGSTAQFFQSNLAVGMKVFNNELYFMEYQQGLYRWDGSQKRYVGPSTIIEQAFALIVKSVEQQNTLYFLVRQRDSNLNDTSDVIIVTKDTVQYLSALVSGYKNVTQIEPFGKSLILALDRTETGQEPYLLTSTVSTSNIERAALELFPNPIASQMLTIAIPERGFLEVYDIFGRIVASEKFDSVGQHSIAIQHLPPGSYVIQLQGDKKVYTGKIAKQ